jgi:hypothetical protein
MQAGHAADVRDRRAFRRDRWHTFVNADVAAGGRRTFRWIRQPALQEPPALVQTPEGLQGGPAAELLTAGPAWQALWPVLSGAQSPPGSSSGL